MKETNVKQMEYKQGTLGEVCSFFNIKAHTPISACDQSSVDRVHAVRLLTYSPNHDAFSYPEVIAVGYFA